MTLIAKNSPSYVSLSSDALDGILDDTPIHNLEKICILNQETLKRLELNILPTH